jgi:hypothetical protein
MFARDADDDAVASASATPGPGHDATPDGMGTNRNAAGLHPAASVGAHSNQAVGRAGQENLPFWELGAGPRAACPYPAVLPRLLPLPELRCRAAFAPSGLLGVGDSVPGNDATARAGIASPLRWIGTSGRCASGANVPPAGGTPHRSTGPGSGSGETAVRNPSTDSAAVETENRHLEPAPIKGDTEIGPRECPTPRVKPRRGAGTSLRGVLIGAPRVFPSIEIGARMSQRVKATRREARPPRPKATESRPRAARAASGRYDRHATLWRPRAARAATDRHSTIAARATSHRQSGLHGHRC